MKKKLLIVESPTKITTIKRLLKNRDGEFIFLATLGHIMDLPEKSLGIDLKTFEPNLQVLPKKRGLLKKAEELLKVAKEVYLATDPDREGEAISFHLKQYLSRHNRGVRFIRLALLEITEHGLKEALKSQRDVDEMLYLSWKARRVLDRLIGYSLSPYLSKLFQKPLSAGRVQTPALRLIVEREEEIENFIPQVSYSLAVKAKTKDGNSIVLDLYKKNKLFKTNNKESLLEFYNKYLIKRNILLKDVVRKLRKRQPPLPLKTSSLIEISGRILGLSPKQTMRIAQDLYEEGYITYMRTDSVRVSEFAKKSAKAYIEKNFGKEYLGRERRRREGKLVQGAHECIRPTSVEREVVGISPLHQRLYNMIRTYFLTSFMSDAEFLEQSFRFTTEGLPEEYFLQTKEKRLVFDGFLRLMGLGDEEEEDIETFIIPDEPLRIEDFQVVEHRTNPPERYTPHSLIKKLESLGIGRPSTFPQIVENLLKRGYVVMEGKYLKPTDLGREVCKELLKKAPLFLDYSFTSQMERALDEIVEAQRDYFKTIEDYYKVLKQVLSS